MATSPALGQSSPSISLELNAAQSTDKGCRLTFVVALFNEQGVVDRLSVLEFKDLPPAKTKVSRFELSGVDCAKISRVLVNGAGACEGEGVDPAACMKALVVSSKTNITFGL